MKQVGILTFHRVINYGAVLQAYALKAVCDELGCETHIIDYRLEDFRKAEPTPFQNLIRAGISRQNVLNFARGLLGLAGIRKSWKNFERFRKRYFNETKTCYSAMDIENLGLDYYIAGSDQIWNYGITDNRFDPVYFLEFQSDAKKMIYAASAQDIPFPNEKERQFQDILEGLDIPVGIREERLAEYVESLTGIRYPVVLDPVLLAGREIMDRIDIPQSPEGQYILLYQIDTNPASDISVRTLEKRFGCRAYTMTVPRLGSVHGRMGEAGPEEFLSLLKGAEFIVTNSFHGTALALLYEKNFFVYENGGVMNRIDGLLELCYLRDRKVLLTADIDRNSEIDYGPVRILLQREREKSMAFLKSGLEGK